MTRSCALALLLSLCVVGCKKGDDEDPNAEGKFEGLGFTPTNLAGAPIAADGLVKDFSCRRVESELSATDTSSCSGDVKVVAFTQTDGTAIDVFFFRNLRIDDPADLIIRGEHPVAFVAFGDVSISAAVRVLAGGFEGGTVGQRDGTGPGAGRFVAASGAGGSYCGKGGATADGATAGDAYGGATLAPLVGGSSGGGGNSSAATGGTGGGAIQIVAAHSITIESSGSINAGGVAGKSTAGGGSGGAILLEAPAVSVDGALVANGGGGGGDGVDGESAKTAVDPAKGGGASGGNGSGGAQVDGAAARAANGGGGGAGGRIRVNTTSGKANLGGPLSPSAKACTSQGSLAK